VDKAMILSNCKIVAEGSPQELVNNIDAKSAYFGDNFNFK
jgi:lipopolysaccharide export system ATP-binding protein